VVQKGACLDCSLDFSCHAWCRFDSMLSNFCCNMTYLKWLRLLNEPFKKSCIILIMWKHLFGFLLWCFISVDLAHAYNMFDSYKVAISLYDHLVFDLWWHFMLLLMMLCRFVWLWPLLLS
jgi:hypothetical protein